MLNLKFKLLINIIPRQGFNIKCWNFRLLTIQNGIKINTTVLSFNIGLITNNQRSLVNIKKLKTLKWYGPLKKVLLSIWSFYTQSEEQMRIQSKILRIKKMKFGIQSVHFRLMISSINLSRKIAIILSLHLAGNKKRSKKIKQDTKPKVYIQRKWMDILYKNSNDKIILKLIWSFISWKWLSIVNPVWIKTCWIHKIRKKCLKSKRIRSKRMKNIYRSCDRPHDYQI